MQHTNLIFGILILLVLVIGCTHIPTPEELDIIANRIHQKVFTIDSHTDTPLRLMDQDFNLNERHDPRKRGGKVDFPRMKEGGLDAIFFAAFVGQGIRTPEGNDKVKNRVQKIIDMIHEVLQNNTAVAELATTPEDADRLEKENKRAVYIGIENGYAIGKDIGLIQKFYDQGARYITLSHTKNNDICDSSTDEAGPEHNGLSEFGKQVVQEMNRVGMMVDVSHISDEAFYDVLEVSQTPVVASHSCARAICDNPRNLDDKMLKKLAANGGVIQMCILSAYVKTPEPNPAREAAYQAHEEKYKNYDNLPEAEQKVARQEWYALDTQFPRKLATVSDVVDHIDHIVKVAGIDHVGIGTDFDGGGAIADCYDVSEMPNITRELVKRGYSEKEIRKIWGGNFMRVFRKVQKYSHNLNNF